MYTLVLTISEAVEGFHCGCRLLDTDDTEATELVATHGPLVIAREYETKSDLGELLAALETYQAYVNSRSQLARCLDNHI